MLHNTTTAENMRYLIAVPGQCAGEPLCEVAINPSGLKQASSTGAAPNEGFLTAERRKMWFHQALSDLTHQQSDGTTLPA